MNRTWTRGHRGIGPILLCALLLLASTALAGVPGHSGHRRSHRHQRTHARRDYLAVRHAPAGLLARAGTRNADLTVSAVIPHGTGALPGKAFPVSVALKRVGRTPHVHVPGLVSVYLSPRASLAAHRPPRGGGAQLTISAKGSSPRKTLSFVVPIGTAPGKYFLIACVATLGRFHDPHPKNNCASSHGEVTVSGSQGPTLSNPTLALPAIPALGPMSEPVGKTSEKPSEQPTEKPTKEPSEEPAGENPPPNTPVPVEGAAPAPGPSDAPAPRASEVATNLSGGEATSFRASIAFLFEGADPIQLGLSSPSVITEAAAALVHGVVTDTKGKPLGGVRVTVLAHGEYGYTDTASDGSFAMAVDGGQTLTFDFARAGYIPVQSTLQVPANQSLSAPGVALSAYQGQADDIDLASSTPFQVAEGEVETDASGTRQVTLLFGAGTHATMHLPGGGSQALTDMHVRATEFTVGEYGSEAMPGSLPPTSAYTYASAFTVDEAVEAGASSVTFDKPVITYVNNFLGFPTGAEVPSGSYDPASGQWGASSNGLVVKILSTSGGTATIAVDSGEQAATQQELSELGISSDELKSLAALYKAGDSLWRVPVTHFSSWDFNFLPEHERPEPPPPPTNQDPPEDQSCHAPGGSTILCDSEAVAEDVPLQGTPFSLHYQSDRVAGYKGANAIVVPITSSESVPKSVDHIDLDIDILGRSFHHEYCMPGGQACEHGAQAVAPGKASGLQYSFVWDRRDGFGRLVTGSATADVQLTYWVGATYQCTEYSSGGGGAGGTYNPSEFGSPYEASDKCTTTARELTPVSDTEQVQVGPSANVAGTGLGEWDISGHDSYDPAAGVLHSGDGADTSVQTIAPVLSLFAGGGSNLGDGEPATEAQLEFPEGVLELADGSVLIADCEANKVREVRPDGTISTFAGTGVQGEGGDGGPAKQASLSCPSSLAQGPDGSIYVTDEFGNIEAEPKTEKELEELLEEYSGRIRKIAPDGSISTVAGGGREQAQEAIGQKATKAELFYPGQIALGPDGSLYIADRDDGLIERVDTAGVLSVVNYNSSTQRTEGVEDPEGIAVTANGEILVSDGSANKVVRIMGNTVTPVAGDGTAGHSGNRGAATQAELESPGTLDIGPDGNLYVAELSDVRLITPAGTIATIAGGGAQDPSQGGIPATAALLYSVGGLAASGNGSLLISDGFGSVLRMKTSLAGVSNGNELVPTDGGARIDEFNPGGRETAVYDSLTATKLLGFDYDAEGRLSNIVDQYGRTTTIDRGGAGEPTEIVAPGGQKTRLTVNGEGQLSKVTDPDGNHWEASYTAGQLTGFTDANGKSSTIEYDTLGRLRADTDQAGGKTTLSSSIQASPFGGSEKVVTVKAPDDLTTTYGDSQSGYGVSTRTVTDPAGGVSTYTSFPDGTSSTALPDGTEETAYSVGDPRFGLAAPIVRELNVITPEGADDLNLSQTREVQLAEQDNPLSLTKLSETLSIDGEKPTSTVYEAGTRTLTTTSPQGRVSTASFGAHDELVSATSTDSSLPTAFAWNTAKGELTSLKQGAHSQAFTYDAHGELEKVQAGGEEPYVYENDADGQALRFTDQAGAEFQFGHDAAGELTSVIAPSGGESKLGYSPVGLPDFFAAPTQASGTSVEYNLRRRPTKLTQPGGRELTDSYDSAGRLSQSEASSSGKVTAAYLPKTSDPRTLQRENTDKSTYTLAPSFDGDAPIKLALSEEAKSVTTTIGTYTYSYQDGRISDMALDAGAAGSADTPLSYDEDGLLTGSGPFTIAREEATGLPREIGDGTFTETLHHDAYGEEDERAVGVAENPVFSEKVTRNEHTGRITTRAQTIAGKTASYSYSYDKDGRLTEVTLGGLPGQTQKYTYDADGNLTSRQSGGSSERKLSYDGQGRAVELGSTKYAYDEDGQLRERGSDKFTYGMRPGELQSATIGATTVTYDYDALGRRAARTEDAGKPERFLYGDPENPDRLTASIAPDGTLSSYFYDGLGRLIGLEREGARFYVATDSLGSPVVIADGEGKPVRETEYDAYGKVLRDSNPSFALAIGYAGGLSDPLTGLVHFGKRDYEPEEGRFTERDPSLFGGGLNLYAYAGDDPIDNSDPTGMSREREELDRAQQAQQEANNQPSSDPPPPAPWYSKANDWLNNHVFYPIVNKFTDLKNACESLLDPNAPASSAVPALKQFVSWADGQGEGFALTPDLPVQQAIDNGAQTASQAGTHSMANGGPGMDNSGNVYGGGY